ncbi:MAG TPA: carboxypeptidase regulatory-like domain-containing protein [Blastocatellia bacterium]|nr:carboxypeptidase regulatory-like domain-containing protein [Blastocatellia bacterium]
MDNIRHQITVTGLLLTLLFSTLSAVSAHAQSTATLRGTVTDPAGGILVGIKVVVRNQGTGLERTAQTDISGIYQVASLPVGVYRVEVQASGFAPQTITDLRLEVSSTVVQNIQLRVGDVSQNVSVTASGQILETATVTVGEVIDQKTVQEIPLNGRHFVDLGLLIPGSVTPPQSGFLTSPIRGQGSLSFNTAGGREDTVNFMINGVNLNDMSQNQIAFQPSINTIQEFKVDNSTFSAEYGRNSGAIVNIATRSGTNTYHGEVFEFIRNDALDSPNFFDLNGKLPFKRNQFGGAVGGPVKLPRFGVGGPSYIDGKDRTFFFFSYEGLRQRQQSTVFSNVPSDTQRAGFTNPASQQLLSFIPRANGIGPGNRPGFIGSAPTPVNLDQWTGDLSHEFNAKDRIHGYYAIQSDLRNEPLLQGNSLPGFGDTRQARRQILTLNETHVYSSNLVNEARAGFNRIRINFTPNNLLNPRSLGIQNGIDESIGLPQITIPSVTFNLGGPANFPQGRADTTAVLSDTVSYLRGRHSFKFGGEFRRFYNNTFTRDTGLYRFNSFEDLGAGNASSFTITLGNRTSSIGTGALGSFVQDSFRLKPNLTLEIGLRYEWNMTPTERYDRFAVFDPQTVSLLPGTDLPYRQNDKNFQPRFGFAWTPFKNGKTVVRGAYAILTDQPVIGVVGGLSSNPPYATPSTFAPSTNPPVPFINLSDPNGVNGSGTLAPNSVDPNFENAYVQSWNLNLQRELRPDFGVQVGYFGSKGTHLRISRNINQGATATRPFARLSANSPILPGTLLNNITEIGSGGNSSYNALWVSATKRLARGVQFNTSYTWSKSIDYNSLNTQGVVIQDSFNLRNNRGLSDFDARHRFVVSALYELPFRGNRLKTGWQLSTIAQFQTGNPVNIVTDLATVTGITNTGRPDLIGDLRVIGNKDQWFTNGVCGLGANGQQVPCTANSVFFLSRARFGNLGRNAVTGPGFQNVDFSILKNTKLKERLNLQFRAEIFDLFNHVNFGQPGNLAVATGPTNFGVISNTRFQTGDSGSSRQMQFALKLIF